MSQRVVQILRDDHSEDLRQLIEQLKLSHPQHGLSMGYVGNLGRCGRYYVDDRDWMVFTRYMTKPNASAHSVSVSLGLPRMAYGGSDATIEVLPDERYAAVRQRVLTFVNSLQERADAGLIITN